MTPSSMALREFLVLAGDHLWQSTVFAAMVALVAYALKRYSASVRYWLWLAASAKFLVPIAALVTLGGYASWRSVEIVPYRDGPVLLETVAQPFSGDAVTLGPPARPAPATSTSWSQYLPAVALFSWLAGTTTVLLRSLMHWLRIRATVRRSDPLHEGREVTLLRGVEASNGRGGRPLPIVVSEASMEPGVFGIFRPVLLWPRAISGHLTDVQIEAVMAHELCHLRRRDNLGAVVHLVVQAAFWFHPLIWRIGTELITERERACDEDVLRRGSEPETYAETILKTCKFFVESPLPCVAGVTGSDLKKRIERIMTLDSTPTIAFWKRAMLVFGGVMAFAAPVAVGALNPPPQTRAVPAPNTLPAFEEVSVRPNVTPGPGGRGGGQMQPGRYVVQNATLKTILRRAYGKEGSAPGSILDLFESQVAGGPEWVTQEKFDIIATTSGPTQPPEMRRMVQRLLAERFELVAHWETRELPVYVLRKARTDGSLGPGLTLKSEADCAAVKRDGPPPMPQPGVPAPPPPCGAVQFGPGQLLATGVPMEWLASTLTNTPVITGLDRMVLNQTGLQGNYGFALKFAMPNSPNPDPERPALATALEEDLGLKLEATRAPVDVLVIDRVEKPAPN